VKGALRSDDAVQDWRQQHQIDELRIELRAASGGNDIGR
jgi:hypothetical protein